jgi:uncharacterized RmlC-like cupin family protein
VTDELRIIRPDGRDLDTAQTPGMERQAGVSGPTSGANGIWMGEVRTAPGFRTGAHHHGDVESAIFVVSGALRMRWGERLEHEGEAVAGDFIFVPARLVHQEINVSATEPVVVIVARGGDNVVVNVELAEAAVGREEVR